MRISRSALCAIAVLAMGASASAQALYGATAAGGPGELYVLDPATGAVVQDVGALNNAAGVNYSVTGLAFNPVSGMLFGSTGNASGPAARLITIDPLTAMVTEIGPFNGPVSSTDPNRSATMADLSFDPTSGVLYGVGSIGGPNLYTVNTATGAVTAVGPSGFTSTSGGGLAIDAAGNVFGTPTSTRYGTYDKTTGAFTLVAAPNRPVGGAYAALAFNGAGTLYGLNLGTGNATHLVTIDTATGTVTDIGASVTNLDAIAFRPGNGGTVPEPSTLALLLGPGLLAIGRLRRRK